MKNSTTISRSSLVDIGACWVYRNQQCIYFEAGYAVALLPPVDSTYKPILDELGIPYHKSLFDDYEFWDPDYFTETKVTLPLFVQIGPDKFQLVQKQYSHAIVTPETTEVAFALFENVIEPLMIEKMLRIEQEAAEAKLINVLPSFLNGHAGCGIDCYMHSSLRPYTGKKLELKHEDLHYNILPVYKLVSDQRLLEMKARAEGCCMDPDSIDPRIDTMYIAVFDMNQLEVASSVELLVPPGAEAIFIGRGGWQIKKWCEELGGLTKINVKPAT